MDTKKLYKMGGAIIGIILFLLLCVILLSSCSSKGNYSKLEKKLLEATEKYVSDGKVVVNEGTSTVVSSDELVSADYIKPLNKIKDDNCTATITVMNNGGAYNYIPNISCDNYKTVTLKEKIDFYKKKWKCQQI